MHLQPLRDHSPHAVPFWISRATCTFCSTLMDPYETTLSLHYIKEPLRDHIPYEVTCQISRLPQSPLSTFKNSYSTLTDTYGSTKPLKYPNRLLQVSSPPALTIQATMGALTNRSTLTGSIWILPDERPPVFKSLGTTVQPQDL